MKKGGYVLIMIAVLSTMAEVGWGQVSITQFETAYNQDFNSLANTKTDNAWTDNSTISGWYSNRTEYIADNGSSTTGGLHSYGSADASERALGGLSSSTASPAFGIRLVNNTGNTITSFNISYKGEQWRQTANSHTLVFSYQVDATGIESGTWTSFSDLDFTALKTGTSSALDGNAEGNYQNVSSNVIIEVPNGHEIWFRWLKTGTNSPGLAIDDLSITAYEIKVPTISANPSSLSGFSYVVGSGPSAEQTFMVSGTNLTADISISAPEHFEISKTSGSDFTSSLTFAQSDGSVNETIIYVRLKAGLAIGSYSSEKITCSCEGADDRTVTCSGTVTSPLPNVWINEIDADQASTDSLEFIELCGISGLDITGYYIVLYNGSNSNKYLTHTVGSFTFSNEINGYGFYVAGSNNIIQKDDTLGNGEENLIQNGDPDAVALFNSSKELIFWYSYGGTFIGNAFDDFPPVSFYVSKSSIDIETTSMGFLKNTKPEDSETGNNNLLPTPGAANTDGTTDQSLPVSLTSFSAQSRNQSVVLSWHTESEIENLGFIIQKRLPESGDWLLVADYTTCEALAGHGSTSEAHEYSYTDAAVVPGATYSYRLGDVDYKGKVTWHKEVEVKVEAENAQVPLVFGLKPAYPNPFNPSVTIPYSLAEDGQMSLKVYNLRGELVEVLISTYALKGTYSYNWSPQNLSAGIYLVRLQSGNHTSMQKIVFVK